MPKITAPTLQAHRAETIDRLLDAVGELVMQRGYADVSLADVAAHVGIARTAIYNYFPDREALLFAWTDREVARTITTIEESVRAAPNVAEKLRAFVRIQFTDFRNRHLPPGKDAMQFLGAETYTRFMRHVEPVEELLRQILKEGSDTGELTAANPDETVPMILACIGAERIPLATKVRDVEDATGRVTSFLLRALGWKQPPRRRPRAAR